MTKGSKIGKGIGITKDRTQDQKGVKDPLLHLKLDSVTIVMTARFTLERTDRQTLLRIVRKQVEPSVIKPNREHLGRTAQIRAPRQEKTLRNRNTDRRRAVVARHAMVMMQSLRNMAQLQKPRINPQPFLPSYPGFPK